MRASPRISPTITCSLLPAALSLLLSTACSSGEEERVSVELLALTGCDDVADRIRDNAIRQMKAELDRNYAAVASADYCTGGAAEDASGGDDGGGDGGGEPGDPGGAADHSETNNQVSGVDEADFVKNDANYIYVAANGALRIIDAWPAAEAHPVAEVAVEGTPKRLFVSGDRALVYSSLTAPEPDDGGEGADAAWWGGSSDCTYGYDCSFTGDGNPTKISIFDIEDRSEPVLERELYLSGSFIAGRRIDSVIHTVVNDGGPAFEGLSTWPEDMDVCGDYSALALQRAFRELRERNIHIIRSTPVADLLPSVREVTHEAGGEQEVLHGESCTGTYATGLADGAAVTSVLSLDLAAEGSLSLTSVVSRPGAVYASAGALYMAVPHDQQLADGWYLGYEQLAQASSVHKFALRDSAPHAAYEGSGVVKGRVLNQFSMDEYEGDLRIATTTGQVPDPAVHSTLTILRESGGELEEIGRVDDIAPTEDIRSVRFDGDHGFAVTFKKTDPLYVFDLTPPEAPRIVGELKIPGFSTYMHLMDEDRLLTIGYDAADQGDFAWFTGVLLQIFDVSDLTNPTLEHKEVIGTRGSSSEALTNHLAFNYYPTREALALPMTVCEGGGEDGSYGETMTFSGLMVYRVTAEDGFSRTGEVTHPPSEDVGCWNWWTDASSQVKRSVFMEDFVYSISETRLKVNAMESLASDLVEIPLD
jgi:hypothetical protein